MTFPQMAERNSVPSPARATPQQQQSPSGLLAGARTPGACLHVPAGAAAACLLSAGTCGSHSARSAWRQWRVPSSGSGSLCLPRARGRCGLRLDQTGLHTAPAGEYGSMCVHVCQQCMIQRTEYCLYVRNIILLLLEVTGSCSTEEHCISNTRGQIHSMCKRAATHQSAACGQ
jgi:hypothetical protein